MPWVHRSGGKVRGYKRTESEKFSEWLDEGHQDLTEYDEYLEAQHNPSPEQRAKALLSSPVNKLILATMLDQENRLRALEGQAPYVEADYRQVAIERYLAMLNQEEL